LALYLIKHYAIKTSNKTKIKLHAFLTSALYGDEWSALLTGRFNHWDKALGILWIEGRVNSGGLVDVVVRKIIPDWRDSNPYRPVP
jgi:hypothetical protein